MARSVLARPRLAGLVMACILVIPGALAVPSALTVDANQALHVSAVQDLHINSTTGRVVMNEVDVSRGLARFRAVLLRNPNLLWQQPARRTFTDTLLGPTTVVAADLNRDGHQDVVVGGVSDNTVAIFWGEGNGTFSSPQVVTTGTYAATSLLAGDMDNDGDLDLVGVGEDTATIFWAENLGAGQFLSPMHVITNTTSGPRSLVLHDVDNDGALDVLVSSYASALVGWFRNEGAAGFSAVRHIATDIDGAFWLTLGDVNGDGTADAVWVAYDGLVWRAGNGTAFDGPVYSIFEPEYESFFSVLAADFDNDGDVDVLGGTEGEVGGGLYLVQNQGDGTFSKPRTLSTDIAATTIEAVDLDGDDDLDLLVASNKDDKFIWFRNNGGGFFSQPLSLDQAVTGAEAIHAADLDGDGLPDIVATIPDLNLVTWYRNDNWASLLPS
ncbi:uncharacterized protein MONBRDRAFT_10795 [Monosiga brevicollis MX1]|uniref:VCBS repeat-containing protein n=1 Tax=Monosiga brevicollis TaxID=81824 RepID=A9V794_MONBE|nr:uncharacterized protein MONBRDRAFT_10795 [Monosiga brevicollis MX1]EDQ86475.1 predicted protein [Monosiga brevicollis MX1]|eukprot:XP_001748588.1 hypothetical protein [Monosiga brevicollis MX1]